MSSALPGEPPLRLTRRQRAIAICSSALAVAGAGILNLELWSSDVRGELESRAEVIHQLVSQRLGNGVGVLTSLAGLRQASESLTTTELASISEQLRSQYPYLGAVSYVSFIPHYDRDVFEKGMRKEGYIDFAIREYAPAAGRPPVRADAETYLPINFIEPMDPKRARWLGVDVMGDPRIAGMAERASPSGKVIAGLSNVLAPERTSLALLRATYFGHFVPESVAERRAQMSGAFLLLIDLNSLLDGIVDPRAGIQTSISEATASSGEQFRHGALWERSAWLPHPRTVRTLSIGESKLDVLIEREASVAELPFVEVGSTMTLTLLICASLGLAYRGRRLTKLRRQIYQREVEESREQFRNLFEGSIQGVAIHRGLQLAFVNQAFVEMLGFESADEVLAHGSILAFLPEEDRERARTYNHDLLAGEPVPAHLEWDAIQKNGSRLTLMISARVVNWLGGAAVQSTFIDITDRKKAERELMSLTEQALAASEAKTQFLANMSHELRTPLNGVIGMLEVLEETPLDTDQRECVRLAVESGETLLSHINDVLDFSKLGASKLELDCIEFELAELVESIGERMASVAQEKGIELATIVDPAVPERVVGDPRRLEQVLVNLTGNAIKFTSEGEVTLRVTLAPADARVSANFRFEVEDTGMGIPPDQQERIFEAFTQADGSSTRTFGGTGLGLAICRQLVEQMNGTIGVDSAPGVGSRFWFSAALDVCPPSELTSPGAVAPIAGRALILVVRAGARQAASSQMARLGIEAIAPEEPWPFTTEGLGGRDAFDLVFVDDAWPAPGAAILLESLRADPRCAEARAVLLTPFTQKSALAEVERFDASLGKPLSRRRLTSCLRELLPGDGSLRAPAAIRAGLPEASCPLAAGRILVVEDNFVNQQVVSHLLRSMGHQVRVAGNGAEALAFLARNAVDVVLMDCQMPIVNGYEATRRIRAGEAHGVRIPVIALTASAMAGDAERCYEAGMDGYLTKPIKRESLRAALDEWLPAPIEERSSA